jgi:hypothetical protein
MPRRHEEWHGEEAGKVVLAFNGQKCCVWDVALLLTLLPDTRISMGVENGNNLDTGFLVAVIDGMRKTAQQGTAHGGSHQGTSFRVTGYMVKGCIQRQAEVKGKIGMVRFVPGNRLKEIGLGGKSSAYQRADNVRTSVRKSVL